jgi:hypothetical protein
MTKYGFDRWQRVRLALALSLGAVLAACGGGGGDSGGGGGDKGGGDTLTFQGVAEEGPPIVNGLVTIGCGNGASTTTTTGAGGAFKVTVPAKGDCIAEVVSQTGDVSLVSIESVNSSVLNITPVTTMVAEFAAGRCGVGAPKSTLGAPQQILDAFRANANFRNALGNPAFVTDTQNQVFSFVQTKYKLNIYAVLGLNTVYSADADTDILILQAFGAFDKSGAPTLATLNTMYTLGVRAGGCSASGTGGTGGAGTVS